MNELDRALYDLSVEEMNSRLSSNQDKQQAELSVAVQIEEMNLFSILNPKLFVDGNKWCVLYGDNIQSGVCGFGDSPEKAVWDFNKSWSKSLNDDST